MGKVGQLCKMQPATYREIASGRYPLKSIVKAWLPPW